MALNIYHSSEVPETEHDHAKRRNVSNVTLKISESTYDKTWVQQHHIFADPFCGSINECIAIEAMLDIPFINLLLLNKSFILNRDDSLRRRSLLKYE